MQHLVLIALLQEYKMLLDKYQLKNAAMKSHRRKLSLQIKQKQESGENLHEVDFDYLKIENRQYLDKIDQRTKVCLTKRRSFITHTHTHTHTHTIHELARS
jgi:aspartyl-tRNA synthetase